MGFSVLLLEDGSHLCICEDSILFVSFQCAEAFGDIPIMGLKETPKNALILEMPRGIQIAVKEVLWSGISLKEACLHLRNAEAVERL